MRSKKIWANLGVHDIERTQEFYLKLGFKLNGNPSKELVSFFFGDERFIIHFFKNEKLRTSFEGEISDLSQGNEIMFTLSAESKAEYDQSVERIKNAGGSIFFDSNIDRRDFYDENGYYVCVFSDPDGHKFNLLYSDSM